MVKASQSLSDNDLKSFTTRKEVKRADNKNSERVQRMLGHTIIPF